MQHRVADAGVVDVERHIRIAGRVAVKLEPLEVGEGGRHSRKTVDCHGCRAEVVFSLPNYVDVLPCNLNFALIHIQCGGRNLHYELRLYHKIV